MLEMQSIRLIDSSEEDEQKNHLVNRRNIIKLIANELTAQLVVAKVKCLYHFYQQENVANLINDAPS